MVQYKTFDLGPFALQKGTVLPDAKIVYATVGRLNDAKDNAVLVPTWGSGSPEDVVGLLIGTARALNPEKYFIVIPNHCRLGVFRTVLSSGGVQSSLRRVLRRRVH